MSGYDYKIKITTLVNDIFENNNDSTINLLKNVAFSLLKWFVKYLQY